LIAVLVVPLFLISFTQDAEAISCPSKIGEYSRSSIFADGVNYGVYELECYYYAKNPPAGHGSGATFYMYWKVEGEPRSDPYCSGKTVDKGPAGNNVYYSSTYDARVSADKAPGFSDAAIAHLKEIESSGMAIRCDGSTQSTNNNAPESPQTENDPISKSPQISNDEPFRFKVSVRDFGQMSQGQSLDVPITITKISGSTENVKLSVTSWASVGLDASFVKSSTVFPDNSASSEIKFKASCDTKPGDYLFTITGNPSSYGGESSQDAISLRVLNIDNCFTVDLYECRDSPNSISCLEGLLSGTESDTEVFFYIGMAHLVQGNISQSIKIFENIIQLQQNDEFVSDAKMMLSSLCHSNGIEEACSSLSSSSQTSTSNPPTSTPNDSDGDGVFDFTDACPNEAGPEHNVGCPYDSIIENSPNSTVQQSIPVGAILGQKLEGNTGEMISLMLMPRSIEDNTCRNVIVEITGIAKDWSSMYKKNIGVFCKGDTIPRTGFQINIPSDIDPSDYDIIIKDTRCKNTDSSNCNVIHYQYPLHVEQSLPKQGLSACAHVKPNEFLSCLEELHKRTPHDPKVLYKLVEMYGLENNVVGVMKAYESLYAIEKNPRILYDAALVSIQYGQKDNAVDLLKILLKEHGDDPDISSKAQESIDVLCKNPSLSCDLIKNRDDKLDNAQNTILKIKEKVPSWIKNNAKWWSEGEIDDNTFVGGLQHLIKEEIIEVPPRVTVSTTTSNEIPAWIKTQTEWWANGQISEDDFLNSIQYLMKNGILRIEDIKNTSVKSETVQINIDELIDAMNLAEQNGEYSKSKQLAEQILEIDSKIEDAWLAIALSYMVEDEYDTFFSTIDEGLQVIPESCALLHSGGAQQYYYFGDKQKALEYLNKAIDVCDGFVKRDVKFLVSEIEGP